MHPREERRAPPGGRACRSGSGSQPSSWRSPGSSSSAVPSAATSSPSGSGSRGSGCWGPWCSCWATPPRWWPSCPARRSPSPRGRSSGVAKGTALVFVAALLGSGAAFLIARYFARSAVERRIAGERPVRGDRPRHRARGPQDRLPAAALAGDSLHAAELRARADPHPLRRRAARERSACFRARCSTSTSEAWRATPRSASAGGAELGQTLVKARRPRGDRPRDDLRDGPRAPRAPRGDGRGRGVTLMSSEAGDGHGYGSLLPRDEANLELLGHVHPPDWKNPVPRGPLPPGGRRRGHRGARDRRGRREPRRARSRSSSAT